MLRNNIFGFSGSNFNSKNGNGKPENGNSIEDSPLVKNGAAVIDDKMAHVAREM